MGILRSRSVYKKIIFIVCLNLGVLFGSNAQEPSINNMLISAIADQLIELESSSRHFSKRDNYIHEMIDVLDRFVLEKEIRDAIIMRMRGISVDISYNMSLMDQHELQDLLSSLHTLMTFSKKKRSYYTTLTVGAVTTVVSVFLVGLFFLARHRLKGSRNKHQIFVFGGGGKAPEAKDSDESAGESPFVLPTDPTLEDCARAMSDAIRGLAGDKKALYRGPVETEVQSTLDSLGITSLTTADSSSDGYDDLLSPQRPLTEQQSFLDLEKMLASAVSSVSDESDGGGADGGADNVDLWARIEKSVHALQEAVTQLVPRAEEQITFIVDQLTQRLEKDLRKQHKKLFKAHKKAVGKKRTAAAVSADEAEMDDQTEWQALVRSEVEAVLAEDMGDIPWELAALREKIGDEKFAIILANEEARLKEERPGLWHGHEERVKELVKNQASTSTRRRKRSKSKAPNVEPPRLDTPWERAVDDAVEKVIRSMLLHQQEFIRTKIRGRMQRHHRQLEALSSLTTSYRLFFENPHNVTKRLVAHFERECHAFVEAQREYIALMTDASYYHACVTLHHHLASLVARLNSDVHQIQEDYSAVRATHAT